MNNQLDNYPVVTDWLRQLGLQKTNPMFCLVVDTKELESEVSALLHRQQADAELIKELVEALKEANQSYMNYNFPALIQKANDRLKERI